MKSSLPTLWMVLDSPGIRSRCLLWLIALFCAAFVLWASMTEVDELVRGEGRVIPSQKLQVVQNLEGGIVAEILVAEGAFVEAGQVLLKMDDTQFDSNLQGNHLKVMALKARAARLRAEVDGSEILRLAKGVSESEEFARLFREEQRLFERRLAQLNSDQKIIQQQIEQKRQSLQQAIAQTGQTKAQLALAQKELDILKPLLTEGVVSEMEVLRAEKARLSAQSDLSRYRFQVPEIEASIAELESKSEARVLDYKSEAQAELNSVLAELPRLSQSSGAMEDRVQRTYIRSPVRGTVKQLWINTVGGVVQPGMDILSIVPIEDSLLVEAKVRPADIARLYPGQQSRVKLTAYDYSIYGGLEAEVVHISADTIVGEKGDAYYQLRVRTKRNNLGSAGQPLPIIPGMVAQVDVVTGKKTILDYLLKPVLKARHVVFTER
jgi:membrane fusion protein, adhesin transport system